MLVPTLRESTAADAEYIYGIAELTMRPHVEAMGKRWSVTKMQEKCANDAVDPNNKIIQLHARDCGVFCVEFGTAEVWLHALLLLQEFQRKGIGGLLLQQVLAQAKERSLPVCLHVAKENPAKAFYEKFGLYVCDENELHFCMRSAA